MQRFIQTSNATRSLGATALIAGMLVAACAADLAAGPPNPNGKDEGAVCTEGSECKSLGCKAGKCTPVTGGNPTNKQKDGDETDVDCGGVTAPTCADGRACKAATDCANAVCNAGVCKAPAPDDGIKNGDETDADCGGSKAPKCAIAKGCEKNDDCGSDACSYAKKCVEFRSCTAHFGGDTCGEGETSEASATHESCCTTVTSGGLRVGKYQVTAGRMRAFVDRWQGNLQQWAGTSSSGWNASWTAKLPASMDAALDALGPSNKRGCAIAGKGSRTFWQPPIDATEKNDFSKDVLDEKALNCFSWYLAQAICVFDGGRLPSSKEITAIRTNDGTTKWPWGATPTFKSKVQSELVVHAYSYLTPNPPADMRTSGDNPVDQSFFVAPPGRRPKGANKAGVQDALGNVMPWVSDGALKFAWTASWENHSTAGEGNTPVTRTWGDDSQGGEEDGYYAIGARCVYP